MELFDIGRPTTKKNTTECNVAYMRAKTPDYNSQCEPITGKGQRLYFNYIYCNSNPHSTFLFIKTTIIP